MSATRRSVGVLWLLGLVALVGSAAGASWVLYSQGGAGPGAAPNPGAPAAADDGGRIACGIGYVDTPQGMLSLYPLQPGRVAEVLAQESKTVEAGAPLLLLEK